MNGLPQGSLATEKMEEELLSVFDIAKRLNVHVRTVRNYVRDGRLRAIRVGKQYRISRADLEAFTGQPLPFTESERAIRQRAVEVSIIVQFDAMSPEGFAELDKALTAFFHAQRESGGTLRGETFYDREIGRLKIVLLGNIEGTGAALKFISSFVDR